MRRECASSGPAAPPGRARGDGAEHEEVHGAQVLLRVPAQEVALQELQPQPTRGKCRRLRAQDPGPRRAPKDAAVSQPFRALSIVTCAVPTAPWLGAKVLREPVRCFYNRTLLLRLSNNRTGPRVLIGDETLPPWNSQLILFPGLRRMRGGPRAHPGAPGPEGVGIRAAGLSLAPSPKNRTSPALPAAVGRAGSGLPCGGPRPWRAVSGVALRCVSMYKGSNTIYSETMLSSQVPDAISLQPRV